MIIDLLESRDLVELSADLCIVGAGAAGISLALSLIDSGIEVLLLESGGLREEAVQQQLFAGQVVDERLHSPTDTYRQRRFGGTTSIWGGRCMPFDPIDFERREFIGHSGWPIGFDDLAPYYPEANRLCEAGRYAYVVEQAFDSPRREMIAGFTSPNFSSNTLERFSCPTHFGDRYHLRLQRAANVRVVLHACAIRAVRDESGYVVRELIVGNPEGQRCTVRAKRYVMATGGLETARLLLAWNLGNDHDVVGRFYMCHLAGTVGALRFNGGISSVWHGYDISDEGVYCRRRLALKAETQRQVGIGNFVARLHHPRITLPEHRSGVLSLLFLAKQLIPYEYAKRLYGEDKTRLADWLQHFANVLGHPFDVTGFAWHMLKDRRLADRKFPSIIVTPRAPIFSLDFHAEQEPNPSSRVSLFEDSDALGVPRIKVDWRYTQGDVRTVTTAIELLARDLVDSGVGSMEYDPLSLEFEMTRYGAYGGHHIGTARMGDDPSSSVVDRDCKVHGMHNLYVASAAVFPTSSQANPTLTIVAIALRLAAHLKQIAEH